LIFSLYPVERRYLLNLGRGISTKQHFIRVFLGWSCAC
jgi:hypothetical protein